MTTTTTPYNVRIKQQDSGTWRAVEYFSDSKEAIAKFEELGTKWVVALFDRGTKLMSNEPCACSLCGEAN